MSTTVTDGGWTAFWHSSILYGPGSLEEAHSVNEKAKELAQYSDVLYTFLKRMVWRP